MLLNRDLSNHKTVIFVLLVVGYFVLNTGNSHAYAQRAGPILLPIKPKHLMYIVTSDQERKIVWWCWNCDIAHFLIPIAIVLPMQQKVEREWNAVQMHQ